MKSFIAIMAVLFLSACGHMSHRGGGCCKHKEATEASAEKSADSCCGKGGCKNP